MSKNNSKLMKWGYAFGGIGKDMCYALVANFLMYYCTENLGISSVFMGILFFVARIWDAVNDPMMGTIVDNTNIKFGRYRFWILLGTLANAVAVVFLFNPYIAMKTGSPSAYIAVLYIVWGMTYTMVDVPFWSFNSNITDDRKERENVATLARLFASAGNLLTQMLTLTMVGKLALVKSSEPHNEKGYFLWACIVSIMFIATILVTTFSIKERKVVSNANSEHFGLREAFRVLYKNDQLMVAVVTFILLNLGMNSAMSIAIYYFKYVWGNEKLYQTFAVVLGVTVGLGLITFPLLSKFLKRRQLFLFSTLLPTAGFVIIFIFNNFITRSMAENTRFIIFCVIGLIFFVGFGSMNILLTIVMGDCVDYGEWKLGRRTENVVFSMQTFLVKFATALSGIITGVGLKIGGYVGNSFDSNTVAMTVVPESLVWALNIMMFVIPPACFIIAVIIFVTKYKLDKPGTMEEIQHDLHERRGGISE